MRLLPATLLCCCLLPTLSRSALADTAASVTPGTAATSPAGTTAAQATPSVTAQEAKNAPTPAQLAERDGHEIGNGKPTTATSPDSGNRPDASAEAVPAPAPQPAWSSTAPGQAATPAPATKDSSRIDADALFDLGKDLFDSYAPEEIKRDYEFPTRAQWDAFVPRLQHALDGNSLDDLASLETEARQALVFLRQFQGTDDLQLWLQERLELIEAARDLSHPAPRPPLATTPTRPGKPGLVPAKPPASTKPVASSRPSTPTTPVQQPTLPGTATTGIPNYDYWLARIKDRPAPAGSRELMPLLSSCFIDEKSPGALAWLAEVESTFNPSAVSPAGACGLYQLMPATAQGLGLSTWMPDDRTHPEKSARAAARLLRSLYLKFGDWPLALAAYNAGEGRIRRLLTKYKTTTFAGIAEVLPVETRLYVPKVLATVATRTGISPDRL